MCEESIHSNGNSQDTHMGQQLPILQIVEHHINRDARR